MFGYTGLRASLLARAVAAAFSFTCAGCGGENGVDEGEDFVAETMQAISYNNHDYIFATGSVTWDQARQNCQDIGYGLVTINNSSEEAFLAQYRGNSYWWTGYNDIAVEGTWKWSNGGSAYTNWRPGEPNNVNNNEDCVHLSPTGTNGWNDLHCTALISYICETVDGPSPTINYFSYSAYNTNSATQKTTDRAVTLSQGQTITVGTCGFSGTSANGDTFLRLNGPNGQEVASADDSCGGLSSNFAYTATASGTYVIKAGCFASESCSGTVGYSF